MLDQRLIYRGGGTYQTATRLDLELAERTFEAGEEVAGRLTHKRSVRQNNLFHAICEHAHDNQRAGPVLPSWRHLKQWLLIHVDYCRERRTKVGRLSIREAKAAGMALAAALRAKDDYVELHYSPKTGEFIERTAKSVRFAAVLSNEMRELFDKVVQLICDEIVPGADPEQFVEHVKASLKGSRYEARAA